MKRNIIIEQIHQTPMERQRVELVERKGIGHPDSLADGIAETVSRELSKLYLEKFGTVLHHNTDEVQIVAGSSRPEFGGGEVISPIYVLVAGRATTEVGNEQIPISDIAKEVTRKYLDGAVRYLDIDSHTLVDCRIGQGSADLRDIYERSKTAPLANDTSLGAGYAPPTETENIVLETEKLINSAELKKKLPEVGEDVKVMGLRMDDEIHLTIAAAMISQLLDDSDHYRSVVGDLREEIKQLTEKLTERSVVIDINAADDYERGIVYLTVTGTSAEMGDDGAVGRGNRANGLITNRPMSMEATSGKNPFSHVGKIYNLLAQEIAKDIIETDGIQEVYVRLLSQIGHPIDNPSIANAQLILDDKTKLRNIKSKVEGVINNWLDDIGTITDMIVKGDLSTF